MVRKLFMTLIAVLLLTSLGFSQTGKISGKVLDRETGEGLPGANVNIVGTTLGAATNFEGEFVVLSVPPGTYTVRATFIGYRDVIIENVAVNSQLTTSLEFPLPAEAIEVSAITIVSERPLVNQNATNAVRIRGYDDLKNLPVRGVAAAVALQPGVTVYSGEMHIRGSRENDVGYYLEGANVRDRSAMKTSDTADSGGGLGTAPIGVIPEALEEFQVQAGGFNAEFGGANAGIIQQTLKTGRSDYAFTIQFETDDFASQGDEFLGTNSYGYRDITATFSGPVPGFNDKLRFFVAGERRLQDDYIQRFNNGFTVTHVDETEFLAMSQEERDASIARLAFPIILEVDRDPDLEARLQQIGLSVPEGNVPEANREEWVANGTLVFDAKPFIFRLGGSFSRREQPEVIGNLPRRTFNLGRTEQEEYSSALINLKTTHLLGQNSFYELNLNYFDRREHAFDPIMGDNFWALFDSSANAAAGIQFTGRTEAWTGGSDQPMEIYGFEFEAPGSPLQTDIVKVKRNYFGGSFNFTSQLPQHEIKFGASYERWTYRQFFMDGLAALQILNNSLNDPDGLRDAVAGDLNAQRGLIRGVQNNFGYDIFGNENEVEGVDGPRHPKYFSAYVQDKFETDDLVVNVGLRLDVIDNDDFDFADPANPPFDQANFGLFEDQLIEKDASVEFSPRLGLAFPVTDRTVFHMQYGRFVQAPRLNDIYAGSRQYNDLFTGGNSLRTLLVGTGLDPEITTQYEIGFNQQFTDNASFDVTTFYKSIKDQIQATRITVDPTSLSKSDYNILQNSDFSTTAGIEFALTLRRTARLAAQVNWTFSRALGTGSVATSSISGVELVEAVPTTISPLDFHRSQVGSFNLDYRFGRDDGGPILEQLGANLLFTFQSGHPYTFRTGEFGQQDESLGGQITDPRSRSPLENVNASVTPWNFQVDLRLDKTFNFGQFDANLYFYVQNLTNRRNVINVYDRTGNAFDDGFLTNLELASGVLRGREERNPGWGAAAYEALYREINLGGNGINFRRDNESVAAGSNAIGGGELLGIPRQIRVGARLEF